MLTVKMFFKANLKRLELTLLNGEKGFPRHISKSEVLRPGLALAGFIDYFNSNSILLFDETESAYLRSLDAKKKREAVSRLLSSDRIPAIIFSEESIVCDDFLEIADKYKICVFQSKHNSTKITKVLSDFLDFYFSPIESIHGTLVDIYGIGVLFLGRSGIGKSEIALDLVERGHRLVADDMIITKRKSEHVLMGEGRRLADHHLEIRGIGLVDVKRLYGIRSVRYQKRIEVIVELVEFDPKKDYDRLGLDERTKVINGVKIPIIVLPVHPGKNITVLSETIALNHLLKISGINAPQEFNDKLIKAMAKKNKEKKDYIDFLQDDYE
jgi:HPr kinase/phosphorylase